MESNRYELFDNKTDKVVYVGTESQCIEYSKEHPDRTYYWVNKKEEEEDA